MSDQNTLKLNIHCPVKVQNGGLFISRGQGTHPTRIIDSHELIYVKQGQLAMWEENQTFRVAAGQTLHLWPLRRHGGVGTLPKGLEFYWIHFDLEASFDQDENAAEVCIPQLNPVQHPEKLESLFRFFLEEQETGSLNQNRQAANLLMMLMLLEAAKTGGETADSDVTSALAARAHTYIRIHFDRSMSAHRVATALGYNPDYLGRIYRAVYGHTLTEAIHRRRIRVACRYLLDSDMTIEQIAHACGFADADYFRRIFRRYMQSTPSAYRKLFARVHVNTH